MEDDQETLRYLKKVEYICFVDCVRREDKAQYVEQLNDISEEEVFNLIAKDKDLEPSFVSYSSGGSYELEVPEELEDAVERIDIHSAASTQNLTRINFFAKLRPEGIDDRVDEREKDKRDHLARQHAFTEVLEDIEEEIGHYIGGTVDSGIFGKYKGDWERRRNSEDFLPSIWGADLSTEVEESHEGFLSLKLGKLSYLGLHKGEARNQSELYDGGVAVALPGLRFFQVPETPLRFRWVLFNLDESEIDTFNRSIPQYVRYGVGQFSSRYERLFWNMSVYQDLSRYEPDRPEEGSLETVKELQDTKFDLEDFWEEASEQFESFSHKDSDDFGTIKVGEEISRRADLYHDLAVSRYEKYLERLEDYISRSVTRNQLDLTHSMNTLTEAVVLLTILGVVQGSGIMDVINGWVGFNVGNIFYAIGIVLLVVVVLYQE